MRIAQVAPLYESVPPKLYGGTERVVSWLTEELVRLGHDVTLFASGDSLTSARLVPVCKNALRLDPGCVDHLAYHVIMLEKVFQDAGKFDLVHFHVDYLHYPLSRRERIPQVTTLHGRLDLRELVPLYRQFQEMPVVSVSNRQREPLPWLNWQGTVYHGLPSSTFSLGNGGGGYLAFIGRTSPEKGLDQAIEMAKSANMPLKIAAKIDRVDQEYFVGVIKPMLDHPLIEFVGEIGSQEKGRFLADAAALLFPINWPEPFGLVMIEAMACGTPVIAYPGGSVSEVMKEGTTGFVVNGIKDAVSALKKLPQIERKRCRWYFERNFSSERMAKEYVAIYRRLTQEENLAADSDGVLDWLNATPQNSTT
jgi:glycosyltransferase involved in cell wall biosynthesis